MTNIYTGSTGVTPQYQSPYPQQAYSPQTGYTPTSPYSGDGYQASPYATGYAQGANTVGSTAMGISGMANGVSSMANSVGGIFGTIFDLIAGILNTVVNIVVNVIEGVLGLFGIGKNKKQQQQMMNAQGQPGQVPVNQMQGMNNANQGMGIATPAGSQVPPPPPGTDIQAAYTIVSGDLQNVVDPNQGIQIINIHAMKARDYRDKAEEFSKEAEKEAREAMYLAESMQKKGYDPSKLQELNSHKSKAMELLNTAQEYTKAVYDEALYSQAANDVLLSKFGNAAGSKGSEQVAEAWKNWIGGTEERKFLIFKDTKEAAPDLFMKSMNAVNANIGRATQILNSMSGVAR